MIGESRAAPYSVLAIGGFAATALTIPRALCLFLAGCASLVGLAAGLAWGMCATPPPRPGGDATRRPGPAPRAKATGWRSSARPALARGACAGLGHPFREQPRLETGRWRHQVEGGLPQRHRLADPDVVYRTASSNRQRNSPTEGPVREVNCSARMRSSRLCSGSSNRVTLRSRCSRTSTSVTSRTSCESAIALTGRLLRVEHAEAHFGTGLQHRTAPAPQAEQRDQGQRHHVRTRPAKRDRAAGGEVSRRCCRPGWRPSPVADQFVQPQLAVEFDADVRGLPGLAQQGDLVVGQQSRRSRQIRSAPAFPTDAARRARRSRSAAAESSPR